MYIHKLAYTEKGAVLLNSANICEKVNHFTISIACDDSCGGMTELRRTDIRVFEDVGQLKDLRDVTDDCAEDCFDGDGVIVGSIENLIKVYEWCKNQ